jgi:hypothetical protein
MIKIVSESHRTVLVATGFCAVVFAVRMLDDRRKQASGGSGARVGRPVAFCSYGISRPRRG